MGRRKRGVQERIRDLDDEYLAVHDDDHVRCSLCSVNMRARQYSISRHLSSVGHVSKRQRIEEKARVSQARRRMAEADGGTGVLESVARWSLVPSASAFERDRQQAAPPPPRPARDATFEAREARPEEMDGYHPSMFPEDLIDANADADDHDDDYSMEPDFCINLRLRYATFVPAGAG